MGLFLILHALLLLLRALLHGVHQLNVLVLLAHLLKGAHDKLVPLGSTARDAAATLASLAGLALTAHVRAVRST